jgi:stearoyl-CoA desaturase (delta-9 desaturase)
VSVHHATYCVNSLAHWLGITYFDNHHSPRVRFLDTVGEDHHNFHHELPQDCRNAINIHQYDLTRLLITFCSFLGLAYNLKTFSKAEVLKGQVFMAQKIKKFKESIPISNLPLYSWDEFFDLSKTQGKAWILIEGIIYDVSEFNDEHPGGARFIKLAIGRDITTAFNGGVHDHSSSARSLLATMRVGVIPGGMEDESLKKNPTEQTIYPVKAE